MGWVIGSIGNENAMNKIDETIDKLWENSNHGTRREDVIAAYNAGVAAECERKQERIAKLEKYLAYAIKESDGWHDECRGTPIDDPEMDVARALLAQLNRE